ncbi:uncharacterized protein A1O9_12845 [Exophiala aquamarina CBS 119918]|uniref:Cupin type-2 domain-containing protein n=1 Tax=Exophiala aquamarina CBS 119918 TaxID=1182545 RepID=A0A072NUQ5_9EURO|nr:uncharacterized protein A1O9_12845 [Exophiala aquamarina CBS 119918]KEF51122.1 hypothetical protein A1O9_12845 [Exophiala aquamarina CBS 119918]
MKSPTVIRWKDLEPSWHLPDQKAGMLRWLINWVAGPEGYYNSNPGHAVLSHNVAVGFQHLDVGNKQKGRHTHTVTEIYIILRGQVLGYDGYGHEHVAGPLDCVYIPAGVPHGVRAYGDAAVDLLWVHDALEKKGSTAYWDESMPNPQDESKEEITVVPFRDIVPNWDAAKVPVPGEMHSMINWVGGVAGSRNFTPEHAMYNDKVAIGLLCIPEGHRQTIHNRKNAELCVVVRGKAVVRLDDSRNEELLAMDAVYVPAGASRTIRNHSTELTYVLWVHERSGESNGTIANGSS